MAPRVLEGVMSIDGVAACSGIRNKPNEDGNVGAATKAKKNHYGFTTVVHGDMYLVPARPYITDTGTDELSAEAASALRSIAINAIKKPSVRKQEWQYVTKRGDDGKPYKIWYRTSGHGPSGESLGQSKFFGETSSARKVMRKVADGMLENQMTAMENVLPNTEATLARKKKRSTMPLIDYGDMKAATEAWVE